MKPTTPPTTWYVWFKGHARVLIVSITGGALVLAGILMLLLPGPGWLTIFAGLAVLGTEFPWARRMVRQARVWVAHWFSNRKLRKAERRRLREQNRYPFKSPDTGGAP